MGRGKGTDCKSVQPVQECQSSNHSRKKQIPKEIRLMKESITGPSLLLKPSALGQQVHAECEFGE
jgi:hypothetical protein